MNWRWEDGPVDMCGLLFGELTSLRYTVFRYLALREGSPFHLSYQPCFPFE